MSFPASSFDSALRAAASSLVAVAEERKPCTASRPSVMACAAKSMALSKEIADGNHW